VNLTKSLDPTRPVTFVTSQTPDNDKAVSIYGVKNLIIAFKIFMQEMET
jgi:hypothetical protein